MTLPDSLSPAPATPAPAADPEVTPQVLGAVAADEVTAAEVPEATPEPTPEQPEPSEAQPLSEDEQAEAYARQDAAGWGEGENRATRVGRAAFALLAGGYLLYAQNIAPIAPRTEWGRWISVAIMANFLIPLVIANLFFAQGLLRYTLRDYWLKLRHGARLISFHDYLEDDSLVAWRLGWKWSPLKRLVGLGVAMAVLMLPILYIGSRDQATRIYYQQQYLPPTESLASWLWLFATLVVYMVCWEWFFRGFLLFSLAQGFGAAAAIVLQAVAFGLAHWGKPTPELISSFAGGLILGVVCWREKSFVPAFVAHALIHIVWSLLVLRF